MSLNDFKETAWAWRRFQRMTETEIAAARTQTMIATMQNVIRMAVAGVLLAGILVWMRAL
jgi:hypothetical protein